MKKPTIEEIKKRFKSYDKFYDQLHQDQRELDNYYELVFDAKVPPQYPTRMPSSARDWIDVGIRHFTLDNPKSKVFQRNDSESARAQVAVLETFYNFWLRKDIARIKDAAKKLLIRGEAFLKVNMDDTYFGNDSEERLFYFPLFMTVPDPINVYASPAQNGGVPADVIESFDITAAEAEAMCDRNGWKWSTKKPADKNVKWFSYYSPEWRCFLLDDEPVLTPEVQPNLLEFCPYVHIGSGAGQSNYEGKPEYMYRSLIWGKRDMLKLEVRTLSALDAINSRYAWPRHMASLSDTAAMDELKKLYPGGVVPTNPDEWWYEIKERAEIKILQGEQPPSGLFQEYAFLQAQAQPPEVLAGLRPQGVYSGQHQETLLATAKPIYKDAFKNLEDGLGVAMGMGARIIEKVYRYPVQIKNFASEDSRGYRKLNPGDINGHYDCEVQLLAEPPEATDVRKALGKGLRQGGSISLKTELRQYHDMSEKESDDEMAQIAAEEVMKEPFIREVVAKDAMTRLGMEKELEMLTTAEQEAKQKVVRNKPPVPTSEGMNMSLARQRGRVTPEGGPAPREQQTTARLP